jgi:uncharacterized SAM-binding protein YcdF (DUF218 family)
MKTYRRKRWKFRFLSLVSCTLLMLLSIIPLRLAIAQYQAPHPQAILTLGGGMDREKFTAQFAQAYPTLDIWVSSGLAPRLAQPIFHSAGIPDTRVHLDYRAADTVTNFTSLVAEFQHRHIQHLFLITSDFHMARAKAIATIVLGSHGITFTPVPMPTPKPDETEFHILRDILRSLLWLVTRRTGASLNPRLYATESVHR